MDKFVTTLPIVLLQRKSISLSGNVEPQCAACMPERFNKWWLNEEQRAKF